LITIDDIKKDVRAGIPVASVHFTPVVARESYICEVSYFFRIIDIYRNVGAAKYIEAIKSSYMSSIKDIFYGYSIENMDHGVDLCRQFCHDADIEFSADDEYNLRGDLKNTGNLFLIVIERPVYKG
jgi:hypothetical protein